MDKDYKQNKEEAPCPLYGEKHKSQETTILCFSWNKCMPAVTTI